MSTSPATGDVGPETDTREQDIAPTYYDLNNFKKGEMKTALQRTIDKVNRSRSGKGASATASASKPARY